jgi:hypothetical protein
VKFVIELTGTDEADPWQIWDLDVDGWRLYGTSLPDEAPHLVLRTRRPPAQRRALATHPSDAKEVRHGR